MFESLTTLVQPWADWYAESARISIVVLAVHLVSMFVGGGMAIGADRMILRADPGSADAARAVVADLSTTHSIVVRSLAITIVSGLLLFMSDVPTFSVSPVYWAKMVALAMLLINGWILKRAEQRLLQPFAVPTPIDTATMPTPFPLQPWRRVRFAAARSLLVWIVIVLLGVVLKNG